MMRDVVLLLSFIWLMAALVAGGAQERIDCAIGIQAACDILSYRYSH